jgi:NACalpha-BTF3-like transcription factor
MCTGVSRTQARDALKHANGDVNQAFLHELHRMGVDTGLLDELAWEYAVCR